MATVKLLKHEDKSIDARCAHYHDKDLERSFSTQKVSTDIGVIISAGTSTLVSEIFDDPHACERIGVSIPITATWCLVWIQGVSKNVNNFETALNHAKRLEV